MAKTLTGEVRLSAKFRHTNTGDGGNPSVEKEVEAILQFASGVVANAVDLIFVDEFSIPASSTGDYDLAGILADEFGATITAAEVVGVIVTADSTNVNNVNVFGAASAAVPLLADLTDKVPVKPGGFMALMAPNAAGQGTVTATSADKVGMQNSGAGSAVTGKIMILMRTA